MTVKPATILAALALAGCGATTTQTTTTTQTETQTASTTTSQSTNATGGWPDAAVGQFAQGCLSVGASKDYCECALVVTTVAYPDPATVPGGPYEAGARIMALRSDYPGC